MANTAQVHPLCKPTPGREHVATARDELLAGEPPYGGLQWLAATEGYFLGLTCDVCGQVFERASAVTCIKLPQSKSE